MDPRPAPERAPGPRRADRDALHRRPHRGLRILALLLSLVLADYAHGADLIILAPTSALGPNVARDRVLEPNWILWPPGPLSDSQRLVRLLSLTTGVDWNLRAETFGVRESGGGLALLNDAELAGRGLFAARRALFPGRRLVPLARPGGALPLEAVALCSDGRTPVRPATDADLRDPRTVVVAIAPTGDAIVRARRAVDGRVLLIETPPTDQRWTRFYLYDANTNGRLWPRDQVPSFRGVPGLLPAREASRLLLHPESFAWKPRAPLLYREADRWLGAAHSGWAIWALVIVSLLATGAALYELSTDRRRPSTTLLAWLVLAIPGAVLLSPALARVFGPESAPLTVGTLLLAIGAIVWTVSRIAGERVVISLLSSAGVLAAAWTGPLHPWSGVLRDLSFGVSPEAIGASALYTAIGISATRDGEGPLWLVVRLANLLALVGLGLHAPIFAFALPLAWAAGMRWLLVSAFPALIALPFGLSRLLHGGIDVRPEDLARSYPVVPVLNLYQTGAFLLSGPTVLFTLAVGLAAMTAAPYSGYRFRRAEPGPGRAAIFAALGLAAASVLTPELWPGVLVALAGGLPLLVADARQTS